MESQKWSAREERNAIANCRTADEIPAVIIAFFVAPSAATVALLPSVSIGKNSK